MKAKKPKYLHRRYDVEFGGIGGHSRIVKGSTLYRMLKSGDLPGGDHTYVIRDGRITREGVFLMTAAELGMSFTALCVLAAIIRICEMSIMEGPNLGLERKAIYSYFYLTASKSRIKAALVKICKMGLIYNTTDRHVILIYNKVNRIRKKYPLDIVADYVREEIDSDGSELYGVCGNMRSLRSLDSLSFDRKTSKSTRKRSNTGPINGYLALEEDATGTKKVQTA